MADTNTNGSDTMDQQRQKTLEKINQRQIDPGDYSIEAANKEARQRGRQPGTPGKPGV